MKSDRSKEAAGVVALSLVVSLLTSGVFFPAHRVSARSEQGEISKQKVIEDLASVPVYFEENQGQFHEKARYLARGTNGFSLFLTGTDAVYVLSEKELAQNGRSGEGEIDELDDPQAASRKPRSATAVYMSLVGGNEQAADEGSMQLGHRTNYFKGSRENWRTGIPNYRSVRFDGVYPGIDMVWHGRGNGSVQYDFIVAPLSEPEQIAWEVKGADSVELDATGDLVIKTGHGDIRQNKPFTYQETDGLRQEIESSFIVERSPNADGDSRIRFSLGSYDPTKPLVIDPTVNLSSLSFSTFLGGNASDIGFALDVDDSGNVLVTGGTVSTAFPTTPGALDPSHNSTGNDDVFVTKLNATGTALIYSTFIGGGGSDIALGIAADPSGNAFITGSAQSSATTYPTSPGAFNGIHNGGFDVFVTKLNAAGSALLYSTFVGGNLNDFGNAIAIDPSGNAFITGRTLGGSPAYPTTAGAFDTTHNGGEDAFVTKLNGSGSALLYSSFIGGTASDIGYSIAIDISGNAYVTGQAGPAFPTSAGAFDETQNGGFDVFVTKFNAQGSALLYSTFIGGNSTDEGRSIAIDPSGDAFITGRSGPNYPTTAGAFDMTHNGTFDVFVTKLNATGSGLSYSTFIGGSADDGGFGIAIDPSGNALIMGTTSGGSPVYPTTAGAYDTSHNGASDVFVTSLNAVGSALLYSTFIGGNFNDLGYGIAIDSSGNTVITGESQGGSPAYPTTAGSFDPTYNGGVDDVFITKFAAAMPTPTPTPVGFESDVSGRPTGDGSLLSNDIVQQRRFVSGLDAPSSEPNEFQRADVSPRATLGDGVLNSTDVVQARRYVSGLDPITNAGGPTVAADPELRAVIGGSLFGEKVGESCEFRLVSWKGGEVAVELDADREIAGVSFRLRYDAVLGKPRVSLGDLPDGAVLTVNNTARGELTILIDSAVPLGTAGKVLRLVEISLANGSADGSVEFDGEASVSDAFANDVQVVFKR